MKTGLLTVQPLTHVAGGDATTLPYNNISNGSFEAYTSYLQSPSTTLLLHMDGADSGTIFTDSSSRANAVTAVGSVHTHAAIRKFGISSGAFNGTTDYLTVPSDQKLTNGSFETWTGLTDLLTDGGMETWTNPTTLTNWAFADGGTGSTLNREASIIKVGTYSAKMTRGTTYCSISQNFYNIAYRGKTLIVGMWVKSATTVVDSVYISFSAVGTGSPNNYVYYSNSGNWEYLTVSLPIPADASGITCRPVVNGADAAAYFDSAIAYEQLPPTGWTLAGTGAKVAREEGTIKVGTYSAKLTSDSAPCFLNNVMASPTSYQGKTVTFGCWVYGGGTARILLYDGVTNSGTYHSGVVGWEYLTVTKVIDAGATVVWARCNIDGNSTTAYFDGAFVTDDAVANFNFGSSPMSIDTWVNPSSVASNFGIFGQFENVQNYYECYWLQATSKVVFIGANGGTAFVNYTCSWTPTAATQYHIEVGRNGTSFYVFIDGIAQTLTTITAISTNSFPNVNSAFYIGSRPRPDLFFNGYLDEFRVSKGVARHTVGFTPQTIAYGQKPTEWTLTGAGAEVDIDTGIVKFGTCAMKLTRGGTNCYAYQDIATSSGRNLAYWKGRDVTLGMWVWADTAARTYIDINDGVGGTNSAWHTGNSTWQYLTATRTLDAATTTVRARVMILTGDVSIYADGAMFNEGSMPYAFQEKPLLLTGAGDANLPGHLIGGDGTTSPYTVLTNGSFESFTAGTQISQAGPTTLLLHMDGVDNGNTFVDSSFRANVVTPVGSAHTHAAIKKFGISSGAFNGTTDYLTVPSDQKLTNGSFETWTASTNIEDENMASITDWTPLDGGNGVSSQVTFDSKSCMSLYTGAVAGAVNYARRTKDIGTFGATTAFSMSIYLDRVSSATNGALNFQTSDGVHALFVSWDSAKVAVFTTAGGFVAVPGGAWAVQDVWQDWTFNVTWTTQLVDIYLNGVLIAAGVSCDYNSAPPNGTTTWTAEGAALADVQAYVNWFTAGDTFNAPPTGWTLSGAGVTVAREEGTVKVGTYSAKVIAAASNGADILQDFTTVDGHDIAYWKGRTVTLGCWVKCSKNQQAYLVINDGVNVNASSFNSGTDWNYLSKTATIDSNASFVKAYLRIYADTSATTAYFDGASVTDDAVANFNFGSGDFTIDTWVRPSNVGVGVPIYSQYGAALHYVEAFWTQSTGKFYFEVYNAGTSIAYYIFDWSPVIHTQYHIEFVRKGSNFYIFINGVSQTLTVNQAIGTGVLPNLDANFEIGRWSRGGQYLGGYLDEFRVTKGVARHTANFTPSTIAYGNSITGWTVSGVGSEFDIDADTVKAGAYSAKMTRSGTGSAYFLQDFTTAGGRDLNYWKGKTITAGIWCNTNAGGHSLMLNWGSGTPGSIQSSAHTGDGTWQYLTVTGVVPSDASIVRLLTYNSGINAVSYWDGATVNEGSYVHAFSELPMIPTAAGNVPLAGHLIGGDGTTGAFNNLYNGSFESFTAGYAQTGGPTTLLLHMDDVGLTDSSGRANAITKYGSVARSATQSKFGGYSATFNGTTDYLTIPSDQKLTNGSFETWTGLTDLLTNGNMEAGSPPSNWTLSGVGAAWTREATTIKEGTYSGKLVSAAVDCHVSNDYNPTTGSRNKTYVMGAWVWCATGSTARIGIADDIQVTYSSYHTGSSAWEYLTVVRAIGGTNNNLTFQLYVETATKTAYFDSVKGYEMLAPTGWTLQGAGATVEREEGTIKVGTYSAKVTRNGANTRLYEDIQNNDGKNLAYWKGRTLTFGCWIYSTIANRANIYIYDGIGASTQAYGQGTGWEYLTTTRVISSSATSVEISCQIDSVNTTAYFDGAFVTDDAAANFNFGSGDFTIDTWIRFSDITGPQWIFGQDASASIRFDLYKVATTNLIYFYYALGGVVYAYYNSTSAWPSLAIDTWYHVELVRSGSSVYIFINGTSIPLTITNAIGTSSLPSIDAPFTIGAYGLVSNPLNGYLDEFRVTKGLARHTRNFTPSTIAYGNSPTSWTLSGAGAEVDIATDVVKSGLYSARLIGGPASALTQTFTTARGINYWKGKTVTVSAWVWCATATKVKIYLLNNDSTGIAGSSYHSGGSVWQYLTFTGTIPSSGYTSAVVGLYIDYGTATVAYWYGVTVNEGSMPYAVSDPVLVGNSGDQSIAANAPCLNAILSTETAVGSNLLMRKCGGAIANGPDAAFLKARGTASAPIELIASDILGTLAWNGFDGRNYVQGGALSVTVTGTVATNDLASRMDLKTTSAGSGTASTKVSISSTGDVTASVGNVVMGTADKGIDFSINSSAAGMTSELLNDYETGTWTPAVAFSGATVGITYGAGCYGGYTKVGNVCNAWGYVILTSKGSSVGNFTMTGLPFTAYNQIAQAVTIAAITEITFTNQVFAAVAAGSTIISFDEVTNAGVRTQLTNADCTNTSYVYIQATYRV